MQISQSAQGKQSLQHVMTPQLQEAIRILQFSYEELVPFLTQQVTLNPFLAEPEEEEPEQLDWEFSDYPASTPSSQASGTTDQDPFESVAVAPKTLQEHLREQARICFSDQKDLRIAFFMIDHVESSGYLYKEPGEIARNMHTSTQHVLDILKKAKNFEPTGVFSASLEENLTLQLKELGLWHPTFEKLIGYLVDLTNGKLRTKQVEKLCRTNTENIQKMLEIIRTLDPHPGYRYSFSPAPSITPEVFVYFDQSVSAWKARTCTHLKKNLHFNESYYQTVKSQITGTNDKRYLSDQLNHANWLRKALQQRNKTLIDVSSEIVQQQQDFFKRGPAFLRPMILKDISDPLGIHESTVSRITTQKYMVTPHGTFELKHFFSSKFESARGDAVSSSILKQAIQKLVKNEDKDNPLSDLILAQLLKTKGVTIARRTIAKYREALDIPPSFQRKRNSLFQTPPKSKS